MIYEPLYKAIATHFILMSSKWTGRMKFNQFNFKYIASTLDFNFCLS